MKENIFPAIRLTLVCLLLFSGIYTSVIWGLAQAAPNKGRGDIITENGRTYYSNIGQKFTDDRYFYSRPSAVDYNAAGAGGSNKGPSNPDYLAVVQARIDSFLVHNPGVAKADIPSDLVTASGGGLDPHISVQAAKVQIQRIAKLRGIAPANLQQLILSHTDKPLWGLLGTERINVLQLNIALDKLK
jgi:potassium-transporting ATPase KdpC subunit